MNRTSLANDIWRACDIMRRDDGTTGSLEYMEQLSWLLFLKVFEAIEDRLAVEAELDTPPREYRRIIGGDYRWSVWAHRDFPAARLVSFIDDELFPYLRGLSGDPERGTIASIFGDIPGNRMKSPYNLRDVIAIVDEIDFQNSDDIYTVSHIYEDLLGRMGSESGITGEFYTPRPIVRFMVERVDPRLGERVYDPACGSAGFLVEAYLHLRASRPLTSTDGETLQRHTFYGKEKKPLPCLLGRMNMILHGVNTPNILRTNTLDGDVRAIPADEQRDVILTNPPFGGKENRQVQRNFPVQGQATELLFLQHIMRSLRPRGRCGVVVPEGVLFRGDAFAEVKRALLDGYDVHTVVSLPGGVFQPYSGVKTNLLFFERGRPTREVWYYEVQPPPGRRFTKGNPIRDADFDELRALWADRPATARSWSVPVAEIVARGYDMTARNPNRPADAGSRAPEELIASALDKEQQIAVLLDELQSLLEAARRDGIARWFPARPDESWPELARVVQYIENGWSPQCLPVQAGPGEWGVLKVGAVSSGRFVPGENKKLPPGLTPRPDLEVRHGDFLMGRANTTELTGACTIVTDPPPRLLLCDKIFRFHFRPDAQLDARYLDYALKSKPLRAQIEAGATGTSSSMKNISKDKVLRLRVPLPPLTEQQHIVAYLDGIQAKADAVNRLQAASAVELDALLPAVLERAFRGEL